MRRLPVTRPPVTRADCVDGPRPCPHRCRHRLDTGRCVLDLAERGGMSLGEVGRELGVTRERARQLEKAALARFLARLGPGLREAMRSALLDAFSRQESATEPEGLDPNLDGEFVRRVRESYWRIRGRTPRRRWAYRSADTRPDHGSTSSTGTG